MQIDLSKLAIKDRPKMDVKVTIGGEEQSVTIQALGGRGKEAINGSIAEDGDYTGIVEILLAYGLGIDRVKAALLLDNEHDAAVKLANEIWKLTESYAAKIADEMADAKKKSAPEVTKSATSI